MFIKSYMLVQIHNTGKKCFVEGEGEAMMTRKLGGQNDLFIV